MQALLTSKVLFTRSLHNGAILPINFVPRRWAGHSKWAKIHRAKGANDQQRSIIFSKLGKAISAAVKAGGPDVSSNLRLASAIETAKNANVPKDLIERAIKSKSDANMIEMTYEGVGPAGISFIVETLTDNKVRTAASLRSAFTKSGGELAATGSQGWIFSHKGQIVFPFPEGCENAEEFEERLMEVAIEAGATDVEFPEDDDDSNDDIIVWCEREDVHKIRTKLEKEGFTASSGTSVRIPNQYSVVPEASIEAFENLLDILDNHEDVQDYVHNAEGYQ